MEAIKQAEAFLRSRGIDAPEVGVVLGSGLGAFRDHMTPIHEMEYAQIPHFPVSTVEFHKGRLIYGEAGGKRVLVMQGRFHYYEGYSMPQIVFPIRVMKALGIQHLLLTNLAGGIKAGFKKGDLVLIDDHINLQGSNPLLGPNLDDLGPRFPDMSRPYSPGLGAKLRAAAEKEGVTLKQGVYASVQGPMLETRAEYRYLRIIGADMVGMSTVPEVIAAQHMGLPCAAVSIISDECDPDNLAPIDVPEIMRVAGLADAVLAKILASAILLTGPELR